MAQRQPVFTAVMPTPKEPRAQSNARIRKGRLLPLAIIQPSMVDLAQSISIS